MNIFSVSRQKISPRNHLVIEVRCCSQLIPPTKALALNKKFKISFKKKQHNLDNASNLEESVMRGFP